MDRFKYSKGPWFFIPSVPQEGFECFWIQSQPSGGLTSNTEIATVTGPHNVERAGNAALISTAPEMYEALRALLDDLPDMLDVRATPVEQAVWDAKLKAAKAVIDAVYQRAVL